jgi:hypothetical protein
MGYDLLFFMVSASWLFDVFSWERLASVATVFGLGIGGAIPLFNMLKKNREKKRLDKEEKEQERIASIAKETVGPIADKLDKTIQRHEEIADKLQQNDKDTRDTLSTVRSLVKEFHAYKNQQEKINTKIYFMDGYIRNADLGGAGPGVSSLSGQRRVFPYRPRYTQVSKGDDEMEEYHQYDINGYTEEDNNNNNNNNNNNSS